MTDAPSNTTPVSGPLRIPASPLRTQLTTALHQALPPLIAFALGRGWLADDTATLMVALMAIGGPILDDQRRTLARSRALAHLARAVPDSVAVVC